MKISLSKVVDGYFLAANARRLSKNTIREYANTFRKFSIHLGCDPPIDEITPYHIRTFLAAQSVTKKTLLNYHIGLSALWTWALKEELVDEHVVRKVGRVTGALHRLTAGSQVGIRGPFGKGFPTDELKGKDVLFVGGGIGLVPLRSLINYVLDNREDYARVTILFGSRSPEERLFLNELAAWDSRDDVEFVETVDRGDDSWTGNVGVITTLFPKIEFDSAKTVCAIVGPPVMYKFVILELKERDVPNENMLISLERRMKCGVGKCGHCQIQDLYVCKDGPVFRYSDIQSHEEAL